MKLELKHIAGYLPYGLECRLDGEYFKVLGMRLNYVHPNDIVLKCCEIASEINFNSIRVLRPNKDNSKPLLRPLSQLTEKISHNGEEFVPVIKLYSKSYEKPNDFKIEIESKRVRNIDGGQDFIDVKFIHVYHRQVGVIGSINISNFSICPKFIIDKLLEWHFDIYNLLNNGLAIEKK